MKYAILIKQHIKEIPRREFQQHVAFENEKDLLKWAFTFCNANEYVDKVDVLAGDKYITVFN